jgi:PPM family protein phosphatase
MKLLVQSFGLSDVGLIRKENEDRWLVMKSSDLDHVLVVADGMGGHQAGEIASTETISTIEKFYSGKNSNETTWGNHENDSPNLFSKPYLEQTVKKANSRVYHLSQENVMHKGMGTTLTLAIIRNERMLIGQVGDSRAYLIRRKKLNRLTKDHSVVQREVDLGILTPEEALKDPRKNIITKAIGIMPELEPDIYEYQLSPNDRLMICSDGLYDLVSEKEILNACMMPTLEIGVRKLIDLAKQYGGKDNITVIMAEILPDKDTKQKRKSIFSLRKKSEEKSS